MYKLVETTDPYELSCSNEQADRDGSGEGAGTLGDGEVLWTLHKQNMPNEGFFHFNLFAKLNKFTQTSVVRIIKSSNSFNCVHSRWGFPLQQIRRRIPQIRKTHCRFPRCISYRWFSQGWRTQTHEIYIAKYTPLSTECTAQRLCTERWKNR